MVDRSIKRDSSMVSDESETQYEDIGVFNHSFYRLASSRELIVLE